MKVTITEELKEKLLAAASADLDSKRNLWLSLQGGVTEALGAYNVSQKQYREAVSLTVGTEVDFNLSKSTIEWTETVDNRPPNWKISYGFKFPSRTGNSHGHEITTSSGTDSAREFVCDCPAGRFGNECWAVKGVKDNYNQEGIGTQSWFGYLIPSIKINNIIGKRIVFPSGNFGNRQ